MKPSSLALVAITSSFSLGTTLPVMSLLLLERGLDLGSLALVMGLYSLVVVATEIPSGIASDRIGRKACIVFSKACSILGSLLLVFGNSPMTLGLAALALALARSFSSGSFEALAIDWHIATRGTEALHRITTMLAIWETLGLAAGSLSVGIITTLFAPLSPVLGRYGGNFVIAGGLQALSLALVLATFEEGIPRPAMNTRTTQTSVCSLFKHNRLLGAILAMTIALGFLLSAIEKYWQPYLLHLHQNPSGADYLLGVLASLGFLGAMGGAILAGRILEGRSSRGISLIVAIRLGMVVLIFFLAMAKSTLPFSIGYGGLYLLIGLSGIPEQTLVNAHTPSHIRASVLSVQSFTLQIGGLLSSVVAALWLSDAIDRVAALWIVSAAILLATIVAFAIAGRERHTGHHPNA